MDVPLDTRNHRFALISLNLGTPAAACRLRDSGALPPGAPVFAHFSLRKALRSALPLCGTLLTEQSTACTVLSSASRRFPRTLLLFSCTLVPASIFRYSPSYSTVGAPIPPGLELVFECVKRDQGLELEPHQAPVR